jgi:26S proteasome regulatory subunit N5
MQEFKVKFFELLAIYHRNYEQDAFELAKDYHAIYSTPHILADEAKWMPALQATVLFLSLSQYGNEQQDMLNRINVDANLEKLPACKMTIQLFLKKEIIHYPLPHQAQLEAWPSFQEAGLGQHWHDVFHRRVIQHNVRVVSIYYKRIHGGRLAQLLQLEPSRLEEEIASMVSDGSVYVKIDRPKDIVRFSAPKSPELILSDWAADIDKLLYLVDSTTHLINKENMTA